MIAQLLEQPILVELPGLDSKICFTSLHTYLHIRLFILTTDVSYLVKEHVTILLLELSC